MYNNVNISDVQETSGYQKRPIRLTITKRKYKMNEITNLMNATMRDMFGINEFFSNRDPLENTLSTNGFKKILRRAHNLIEVRNKKGETIAQKIEVVTTPFTKDEVKVTIKNNVLNVSCGSDNKECNESEFYVYHGISSQSYRFALSIPETIDQKKIKATNKDGILTIVMPIKEVVNEEPKEVEITIE